MVPQLVQHMITTLDDRSTGAPEAPVAVNPASQSKGGPLDFPTHAKGLCVMYDRWRPSAISHHLCALPFDELLFDNQEGSSFEVQKLKPG